MKTIKGNKMLSINKASLTKILRSFRRVEIDLGTGDGRFIYKGATKNPKTFFIGIDPNQKQLEIYSKKAVRNKVENILFVLGSIELLPTELTSCADAVHINFPWGSLLGNIVNTDPTAIKNISSLIKRGGRLNIIIGYSQDAEPSEVERLNLEKISKEYILNEIKPGFEKENLKLTKISTLSKDGLSKIESTWGKKLRFGQERPVFRLQFAKH